MAGDAWAVVVAGLGGGVLGAAGAMAAIGLQHRFQRRDAGRDDRQRAYVQLLAASFAFANRADFLQIVEHVHTRPLAGLRVLFRFMRPVDVLDLDDRLQPAWRAVQEAWSAVWVVGSPEAIRVANDLVFEAAEVVSKRGDERMAALQQVGRLRADLGALARKELGQAKADLFGVDGETEPSSPGRGL